MRAPGLAALCKAWELPPSAAEAIGRTASPCVFVVPEACDESEIPLGHSKVGGRPDLPDDIEWPWAVDHPTWFLAQIRLADLPWAGPLPHASVLWFFYDDQSGSAGPGSRVLLGGEATLARRDCPHDPRYDPSFMERHLPAQRVELRQGWSLPWTPPEQIAGLVAAMGDYVSFHHDARFMQTGGRHAHQLFGFPTGWLSLPAMFRGRELLFQFDFRPGHAYFMLGHADMLRGAVDSCVVNYEH